MRGIGKAIVVDAIMIIAGTETVAAITIVTTVGDLRAHLPSSRHSRTKFAANVPSGIDTVITS